MCGKSLPKTAYGNNRTAGCSLELLLDPIDLLKCVDRIRTGAYIEGIRSRDCTLCLSRSRTLRLQRSHRVHRIVFDAIKNPQKIRRSPTSQVPILRSFPPFISPASLLFSRSQSFPSLPPSRYISHACAHAASVPPSVSTHIHPLGVPRPCWPAPHCAARMRRTRPSRRSALQAQEAGRTVGRTMRAARRPATARRPAAQGVSAPWAPPGTGT